MTNATFDTDLFLPEHNATVTELYGSVEALCEDWVAEEIERLDWLTSEDVVDLVYS